MLLIPIGQVESVVRRTPWVSFALIGLNILIFLVSLGAGPGDAAIDADASQFLDYLGQHPYLEPPDEIVRILGPDFEEQLEKAREEWKGSGAVALDRGGEQAQLDGLGEKLIATLRERPAWRFGFVPAEPRTLGAVSSMFMHADWLHLIGNMLFLFLSGPFIEDCYGRAVFAAFYVLSHFAAIYGHMAHNPDSLSPLVGASGAIAGIMGAFLVRLGARRIRFLFLPIPILPMIRRQVALPAFVVLPLWLGEQLVYARADPQAGVAWWAHIGGFAFGVSVALLLKGFKVEERYIHPAIEKEIGITQNPALERAMEARLRGDLADATREIRNVLRAEPDNVDAWRETYEAALEKGDAAEAGRAGERLLGLLVRQKEPDLASELAYDSRWREMEDIPTRFVLAVAGHLERAGDARAALDEYAAVVAREPGDSAALRALVRRAEILKKGGDVKGARAALLEAKAHPACIDSWPPLVEKALRDLAG